MVFSLRFSALTKAAVVVLFLLLLGQGAAQGQSVQKGVMRGEAWKSFGRVIFEFAVPVQAKAQVAGGVLIVRFDSPVELASDKLAAMLPGYITAVRVDPDRMSLRLALARAVRADLKDAAEQLYLDLLPIERVGPAPPLPSDVTAQLAQRVRAAREAARVPAEAPRAEPAAIGVSLARTTGRIRLTFALGPGQNAQSQVENNRVSVMFDGAAKLDRPKIAAALAGTLDDISFDDAGPRLHFALPHGMRASGAMDDGAFALDLISVQAPAAAAIPTPEKAQAAPLAEAPDKATAKHEEEKAAKPEVVPSVPALAMATGDLVFDAAGFASDQRGNTRETGRNLLRAAADAPKRRRTEARYRLAEFYLANRQATEAYGVLEVIAVEDPKAGTSRRQALMKALALILRNDHDQAKVLLRDASLALDRKAALLRAGIDAQAGHLASALEAFRANEAGLDQSPDMIQAMLRPLAIDAALAGNDTLFANQQLAALERLDADDRDPGLVPLYRGRIAEASGQSGDAMSAYDAAARTGARPVEAAARLARILLGHSNRTKNAAAVRAELETLAMIWRRGPIEVKAQARLAELAAGEGRWRDAFAALRRAVEIQPDHAVTRALQDDMGRRFEALFLGNEANGLPKIEALAIFDEFRSLVPPGPRGDAIVRRLSDCLADLDLIPQAIELLRYQIERRLKGASRAEAATRLALLYMMEGKPQDALGVLKATRFTGLSPELRSQRLQIEARALSELSHADLALEILGTEAGHDVERLRADILWRAKRWQDAAESYERALGQRWADSTPLDPGERGDLMRAAIAYVLASDKIGADRLRTNFMTKMADAPDAEMFRLVTIDRLSHPNEFGEVARKVVGTQTMGDFLAAYHKRFPTGGADMSTQKAGQ